MTKFISLLLLLPLHSAAFVISPNRILSFCRTFDDVDSSLYSSFDDAIVEDQDDEEPVETPGPPLPGIEKAWRHAKKPLLRVGGKGFTKTHGNSLRQLLEDHTVVKVKLNTKKYGMFTYNKARADVLSVTHALLLYRNLEGSLSHSCKVGRRSRCARGC